MTLAYIKFMLPLLTLPKHYLQVQNRISLMMFYACRKHPFEG